MNIGFFSLLMLAVIVICFLFFRSNYRALCFVDEIFIFLKNSIMKYPLIILSSLLISTSLIIYWRFIIGKDYFIFSDIGSDTMLSYVPIYNMVIQKLASGNFTFWEFSYGLGTNILAAQTTIFDPFNVPIYIVGVIFGTQTVNYMLIIMHIMRVFCASYICYLYLSEFRFSNASKIVASYLYGFNGFIMLWGQHYFFGTAAVMLILILLCIEKCLRNYSSLPLLALSTCILLIFSSYLGYMILLFGGIYTVYRVVQTTQLRDWAVGVKRLILLGFGVLVGVFSSMIVFLPSLLVLLNIGTRIPQSGIGLRIIDSLTQNFSVMGDKIYQTIFLRLFSNNFQGVGGYFIGVTNYYEAPQYFFSSFIFVFCIFFVTNFISEKRGKKANVLLVLALMFFLHFITMPTLGLIFNGVTFPNFRSSFIIMPIFAYIVATSCDLLISKKLPKIVHTSVFLGIGTGLIACLFVIAVYIPVSSVYAAFCLILYCLVGITFTLFCKLGKIKEKRRCLVVLVMIIVLNVSVEGYIKTNIRGIASEEYPQIRRAYLDDSTISAINALHNFDVSFYRLEKSYSDKNWIGFIPMGENLRQQFNGLAFYNSIPNGNLVNFFHTLWPERLLWGNEKIVTALDAYKRADLSALLNIKYYLSRANDELTNMSEYQLIDTIEGIHIYRNLKAGGFGILFDSVVNQQFFLTLDQPMQHAVLRHYIVIDNNNQESIYSFDLDMVSAEWEGFSEQSVDFHRIRNDSNLLAQLDTSQELYLFMPIPYEDGWQAFVNGEKTEILQANLGFMAINLYEGSNLVELRYRTPGLEIGGFMSITGMLMFFGMIQVPRVSRSINAKRTSN